MIFSGRSTLPSMATTKLRPDDPGRERLFSKQNEQVRRIAREVLREQFGGVGTKMADAVGITQPNLSRFLSGKQGTTRDAALRILALASVDPEVVGLDAPASDVFPRKPIVLARPLRTGARIALVAAPGARPPGGGRSTTASWEEAYEIELRIGHAKKEVDEPTAMRILCA